MKKIVLYGSEIWYRVVVRINTKLLQIQRYPLLSITKYYRTVASESLCALSGCLPLDFKVKEECDMHKFKLNKLIQTNVIDFDRRIYNCEIFKNELIFEIEKPEMKEGKVKCFTDGSKQNNRVGAAFVVFDYNNLEIYHEYIRLPDYCTVFMAEVIAINNAITYLHENFGDGINI